MRKWLALLFACLALTLVVAGCGGDDDDDAAAVTAAAEARPRSRSLPTALRTAPAVALRWG